jgi:hypothetical protein
VRFLTNLSVVKVLTRKFEQVKHSWIWFEIWVSVIIWVKPWLEVIRLHHNGLSRRCKARKDQACACEVFLMQGINEICSFTKRNAVT